MILCIIFIVCGSLWLSEEPISVRFGESQICRRLLQTSSADVFCRLCAWLYYELDSTIPGSRITVNLVFTLDIKVIKFTWAFDIEYDYKYVFKRKDLLCTQVNYILIKGSIKRYFTTHRIIVRNRLLIISWILYNKVFHNTLKI